MKTGIPFALCLLLALIGVGCGSSTSSAPPSGVDPRFFGVAPQEPPSDVEISRMARGGVGSYHLLIAWPRVEQIEGSYDWSLYDGLMTALAAEGIEPIPYLFGTSSIYEPDPITPPVRDAETFDAWAAFVEAAVDRYGPDGELWQTLASTRPEITPSPPRVWEIWNEMNGPAFWDPIPDVDEYAKLLKRTARVIGGSDPDAQIMTGGMFRTPSSEQSVDAPTYLRDLYRKRGIADVVDVVGVHPYGPEVKDVDLQVDDLREAIDDAGDDAGLFITEFGWGSDDSVQGQLSKDPVRQAELLSESYRSFLDRREEWRLEGALWYTWRDPVSAPPNCSWCPAAGLFDRDLDPKPSWDAFTEFTGGES